MIDLPKLQFGKFSNFLEDASLFGYRVSDNRKMLLYGGFGALSCVVIFRVTYPFIRPRFLAWLINSYTSKKTEERDACVTELMDRISTFESKFPEMKEKKALRILEIGVGAGANLRHYPNGTHLIVVEPNSHMIEYYKEAKKSYPNIQSDEVIIAGAEDIDMVPGESVDVVVSSNVLCSVSDAEQVVSHICRVLVTGGKFVFLEHVQDWNPKFSLRRVCQNLLDWSGFWAFMFGGCRLTCNTHEIISAGKFSHVDYDSYYASLPIVFSCCRPHVRGIATK